MKKIIICICVVIAILVGISICYVIDMERMENNEPVIFSTWGYCYVPPVNAIAETPEPSKLEKMYQSIIDHIIGEDSALNHEAKYIALDLDSFVSPSKDNQNNYLPISEEIKNNLLEYCKKYNSNVKYASFDDLKAEGLFNEDTYSLEGILIYVSSVEKLSENKAKISVVKYRSGLGAIFPEYELTYKNDKWEIEVKSMAIS